MMTVKKLIKRNIKLFFKDKGMFLVSLITPCILLVLYVTFLGNVYRDSFISTLPEGFVFAEELVDGYVGAQLISSILAVSCITVAFCSNMLMVQDKANGTRRDLAVSPIKSHVLAVSYYFATIISTSLICLFAMAVCLVYVGAVGFYMSVADVLFLVLDVLLLVMLGTALSSVINFFLSSQGQISAVGTIVSSGYGFISGAYMPISQFSEGLQTVIKFLPGTYGTSLVRYHSMRGVLEAMTENGFPEEAVTALADVVDCNIYIGEDLVSVGIKYLILSLTVAALVGIYVLLNVYSARSKAVRKV
ncbi:MAG: ABC transporter permease [Ruminococcaceae bacterium]|nr:ABC transporter permease [Oscillospiraceae bacterium]